MRRLFRLLSACILCICTFHLQWGAEGIEYSNFTNEGSINNPLADCKTKPTCAISQLQAVLVDVSYSTLRIYRADNPYALVLVSSLNMAVQIFTVEFDAVEGNVLLLGMVDYCFGIVNVTYPLNPQIVQYIRPSGYWDWCPYCATSNLLVTAERIMYKITLRYNRYNAEVLIYNFSDLANPVYLAKKSIAPATYYSCCGSMSTWMMQTSDNIIQWIDGGSLRTINITQWDDPQIITSVTFNPNLNRNALIGMVQNGTTLFFGDMVRLHSIDVSNELQPVWTGSVSDSSAKKPYVNGSLVVTSASKSWDTHETAKADPHQTLSKPQDTLVGNSDLCILTSNGSHIKATTLDGSNRVAVAEVSNVKETVLWENYILTANGLLGIRKYVASEAAYTAGSLVLDAIHPARSVFDDPQSIDTNGNIVIAAAGSDGLRIYSFADLSHLGALIFPEYFCYGARLLNDEIAVVALATRVATVNISNPAQPFEIGSVSRNGKKLEVGDNVAYLYDQGWTYFYVIGLVLLEEPTYIRQISGLPTLFCFNRSVLYTNQFEFVTQVYQRDLGQVWTSGTLEKFDEISVMAPAVTSFQCRRSSRLAVQWYDNEITTHDVSFVNQPAPNTAIPTPTPSATPTPAPNNYVCNQSEIPVNVTPSGTPFYYQFLYQGIQDSQCHQLRSYAAYPFRAISTDPDLPIAIDISYSTIRIYRVDIPSAPLLVSTLNMAVQIFTVEFDFTDGAVLLLGMVDYCFGIVNVTYPLNPQIVQYIRPSGYWDWCPYCATSNLLVTAERIMYKITLRYNRYNAEVLIYNFSDLANPVYLAKKSIAPATYYSCCGSMSTWMMQTSDNIIQWIDGGSLRTINITQWDDPQIISSVTYTSSLNRNGRMGMVQNGTSTLYIGNEALITAIEITNETSPEWRGGVSESSASRLMVNGSIVMTGSGRVYTVDPVVDYDPPVNVYGKPQDTLVGNSDLCILTSNGSHIKATAKDGTDRVAVAEVSNVKETVLWENYILTANGLLGIRKFYASEAAFSSGSLVLDAIHPARSVFDDPQSIDTNGNIVIAAAGSDGLRIYSFADLSHLGALIFPEYFCYGARLLNDEIAVVALATRVATVNISNTAQPFEIGSVDRSGKKLLVGGSYAYVYDQGWTYFHVINLLYPTQPKYIRQITGLNGLRCVNGSVLYTEAFQDVTKVLMKDLGQVEISATPEQFDFIPVETISITVLLCTKSSTVAVQWYDGEISAHRVNFVKQPAPYTDIPSPSPPPSTAAPTPDEMNCTHREYTPSLATTPQAIYSFHLLGGLDSCDPLRTYKAWPFRAISTDPDLPIAIDISYSTIRIYRVDIPSAPLLVSTLNMAVQIFTVEFDFTDGAVLLLGMVDYCFGIVNVTYPLNPQIVQYIRPSGYWDWCPYCATSNLLVTAERIMYKITLRYNRYNAEVLIYNFSDLANPVYLAKKSIAPATYYSCCGSMSTWIMQTSDNIIQWIDGGSLRTINITQWDDPQIIGRAIYSTSPNRNGRMGMVRNNSLIYIGNEQRIDVIDVNSTTDPEWAGGISDSAASVLIVNHSTVIDGNGKAYLVNEADYIPPIEKYADVPGTLIGASNGAVYVENSTHLTAIAKWNDTRFTAAASTPLLKGVAMYEDDVVTAQGPNGIYKYRANVTAFDFGDMIQVAHHGVRSAFDDPQAIDTNGNVVVTASGSDGLRIYDFDNLNHLGNLTFSGYYCYDVKMINENYVVAVLGTEMVIVDITDRANPSVVSSYTVNGKSVSVANNISYVTEAGRTTATAINVTNITNPTLANTFPVPSTGGTYCMNGSILYRFIVDTVGTVIAEDLMQIEIEPPFTFDKIPIRTFSLSRTVCNARDLAVQWEDGTISEHAVGDIWARYRPCLITADCNGQALQVNGTLIRGCSCECVSLIEGEACDQCVQNYTGWPSCYQTPCTNVTDCSARSTNVSGTYVTGCTCDCMAGYVGDKCEQCATNYSGHPNCVETPCISLADCNDHAANVSGTLITGCSCDICKVGYVGSTCDACETNYTGYPTCAPILCTAAGNCSNHAASVSGDYVSGCGCTCSAGYTGNICDACAFNYSGYPSCAPIVCSNSSNCSALALAVSGDYVNGCTCTCLTGVDGASCELCAANYSGYPNCEPILCTNASNCNTHAGALSGDLVNGCSCTCQAGYVGTSCDACDTNYTGYPSCLPIPCTNVSNCSSRASSVSGDYINGCGCLCLTGYAGAMCEQCATNYSGGYPNCTPDPCTNSTDCNDFASSVFGYRATGCTCSCVTGYGGGMCENCAANYEGYPTCVKAICTNATDCFGYATAVSGNRVDGCSCTCMTAYSQVGFCGYCDVGFGGYPNCRVTSCTNSSNCSARAFDVYGDSSVGCTCTCLTGYNGSTCDACDANYTGYPSCLPIPCTNVSNCSSRASSVSGDYINGCGCLCLTGYAGAMCEQCNTDYEGYPSCAPIACSNSSNCSALALAVSGDYVNGCTCTCLTGVDGASCELCAANYSGYPNCEPILCTNASNCNTHASAVSGDLVNGCSCTCQAGYVGTSCDACDTNYMGYPTCVPIPCNNTVHCSGHALNMSGNSVFGCACTCVAGYTGSTCNTCAANYQGYPDCVSLACTMLDANCTNGTTLAVTGDHVSGCGCSCATSYGGSQCDQCAVNYEGFPTCQPVPCSNVSNCNDHAQSVSGDYLSGCSCFCHDGYEGGNCERCTTNYTGYPNCAPMKCALKDMNCSRAYDVSGDIIQGCRCVCQVGFGGRQCNQCGENYEGYPMCLPILCSSSHCSYHSTVVSGFLLIGCTCTCEEGFAGNACEKCDVGYGGYPDCVLPPPTCPSYTTETDCTDASCIWLTSGNECSFPSTVKGEVIVTNYTPGPGNSTLNETIQKDLIEKIGGVVNITGIQVFPNGTVKVTFEAGFINETQAQKGLEKLNTANSTKLPGLGNETTVVIFPAVIIRVTPAPTSAPTQPPPPICQMYRTEQECLNVTCFWEHATAECKFPTTVVGTVVIAGNFSGFSPTNSTLKETITKDLEKVLGGAVVNITKIEISPNGTILVQFDAGFTNETEAQKGVEKLSNTTARDLSEVKGLYNETTGGLPPMKVKAAEGSVVRTTQMPTTSAPPPPPSTGPPPVTCPSFFTETECTNANCMWKNVTPQISAQCLFPTTIKGKLLLTGNFTNLNGTSLSGPLQQDLEAMLGGAVTITKATVHANGTVDVEFDAGYIDPSKAAQEVQTVKSIAPSELPELQTLYNATTNGGVPALKVPVADAILVAPPTPAPTTLAPTRAPEGIKCALTFTVVNDSFATDFHIRDGSGEAIVKVTGSLLNNSLVAPLTVSNIPATVRVLYWENTTTWILIQFEKDASFELLDTFTFDLTLPPVVFLCPPQSGALVVFVGVRAKPPEGAKATATAVQVTTSTAVSSAAIAGGGAAAADAQLLVVMGQMNCASKLDRQMSGKSIRAVSPIALDDSFLGIVGGNFVLMFGLCVLQGIAVSIRFMVQKVPLHNAMTDCRFPSLTLGVALLMHQGISWAGLSLLFQEGGKSLVAVGTGIGTILYCIMVPLATVVLVKRAAQEAIFQKFPFYEKTSGKFKKFFLPEGTWTPKGIRNGLGAILRQYRPGKWSKFTFPIEIMIINTTSILAAIAPHTPLGCRIRAGSLVLALIIASVICAFMRPYRSQYMNVSAFLSRLLLAVVAGCAIMVNPHTQLAGRIVTLTLIGVTITRVLYAVWLSIAEGTKWRRVVELLDSGGLDEEKDLLGAIFLEEDNDVFGSRGDHSQEMETRDAAERKGDTEQDDAMLMTKRSRSETLTSLCVPKQKKMEADSDPFNDLFGGNDLKTHAAETTDEAPSANPFANFSSRFGSPPQNPTKQRQSISEVPPSSLPPPLPERDFDECL